MMFASSGLGIYPDWQYSGDPAVNPKINPNVKYPDGVYQTTPQPLGPYYGGDTTGLGMPVRNFGPLFGPRPVQLLGLRGFGTIGDTVSSIGTFIILGLAAFGGWGLYKRLKK